jgi:hypothetical protein
MNLPPVCVQRPIRQFWRDDAARPQVVRRMKFRIHTDVYTYPHVSNLTVAQGNPHIFIMDHPLQSATAIHLNRAE